MIYRLKTTLFLTWFLFLVQGSSTDHSLSAQVKAQVLLRDHSLIQVDMLSTHIPWSSVTSAGEIRVKQIPVTDIRSLRLVVDSSSQEAAEVLANLSRLEAPEYKVREAAEEELTKRELVTKYRTVIQNRMKEFRTYDARYRATRILEKYSRIQDSVVPEFDQLLMKRGQLLRGGVPDVSLEVMFQDRKLKLSRSRIQRIWFSMDAWEPSQRQDKKLSSRVHLRYDSKFAQSMRNGEDGVTVLNFSRAPNGRNFLDRTSVETTFANQGVLFVSPNLKPGYVGISEFDLSSLTSSPSNGLSIAPYSENSSGNVRAYEGSMAIRFCQPGNPSRPAAVNRIAFSLAKCKHHRDIIMEAFNADNQIVATAEATSQQGVFMGVESNEPIVRVEIKSNPYLENAPGFSASGRVIDNTFAIDDVCFSRPFPIAMTDMQLRLPGIKYGDENRQELLNRAKAKKIRLLSKRGDVLLASEVKFLTTGVQLTLEGIGGVTYAYDEVDQLDLAFPKRWNEQGFRKSRLADPLKWHAVLADRSVIAVNPNANFKNEWQLSLAQDDIVGTLPSFGPARLTRFTEFPCLVFPTCTIISNSVQLKSDQLVWSRKSLLSEDLILPEDKDEVQPTNPHPEDDIILFDQPDEKSRPYVNQLPSIWYRQLEPRNADWGQLLLRDNQRLTLGGDATAKLIELGQAGVIIEIGGKRQSLEWDRIAAIQRSK